MGLGNYVFWPIYCFISVLPYLVMAFYILDIKKYRKQLGWFFVVFALFFYSIEYFVQAPNPQTTGATEYWIYSITHAVSTFVALAVFAYLTDGFFPRTFIKIDIYFDVISFLTYLAYIPVENAIFKALNIQDVAISLEGASKPVDLWLAVPYLLNVIVMVIIFKLFDKKLTALVNKIPDIVCTVIFLGMFSGYIVSIITLSKQFTPGFDRTQGVNYEVLTLNRLFIAVGCILIGAMLLFALTNRRHANNMKLEAAMQYEYYKKVAEIHNDVRYLRHDIANHISAMNYSNELGEDKYEQALKSRCQEIREGLANQQIWTSLKSQVMSNRETYELYQYVCKIAEKYCGNSDVATFAINHEAGREHIIASIPTTRGSVFMLKRNSVYVLIKSLVQAHSGAIAWTKTPEVLQLNISMPLEGAAAEGSEVAHD